eukprot:TRINITY_DN27044_c2_g1_i1.p1 TRINITY_DN27044_c2_g1~~TRINITY_DN27044_c2_g1_i1.p1  ORF type:complete len:303 (+),score=66.92 TRINITY_DN27044_c2_g1_i1:101-1009(+)
MAAVSRHGLIVARRGLRAASTGSALDAIWHVTAETRVAGLAGAIYHRAAAVPAPVGPNGGDVVNLPCLDAMGPAAISRALNGIALCNQYLQRHGERSGARRTRVAFAPSIRHFAVRQEERARARDAGTEAHVRQSLQFALCQVDGASAAGGAIVSAAAADDDDVLRVAAQTDPKRLAGLVVRRWQAARDPFNSPPPLALQAMGPACINTMARALAVAWQRVARSVENDEEDEEDEAEAAFCCVPVHLALRAPGAEEEVASVPGRVSGLSCRIVPLPSVLLGTLSAAQGGVRPSAGRVDTKPL